MKEKVKISKRNSAYAELKNFCLFAMGEKEKEEYYLDVTEWTNGEGIDIEIWNVEGRKKIHMTWGEWDAIKACVKAIQKDQK